MQLTNALLDAIVAPQNATLQLFDPFVDMIQLLHWFALALAQWQQAVRDWAVLVWDQFRQGWVKSKTS